MADASKMNLLDLARIRFDEISVAEQKLFEAASEGRGAECASLPETDRLIRGARITWLCTDPDALARVTYRGISMKGAIIRGNVDLEWAKVSHPIIANNCIFTDEVILSRGQFTSLNFGGSSIKRLNANFTQCSGNIFLRRGFSSEGPVDMISVNIGGDLDCDEGHFVGAGKLPALNANSARIKGYVFMRNGFEARGEVNFSNATIGLKMECDGGKFFSTGDSPALSANGAIIQGGLFMRNEFKADGGVDLVAAAIGFGLDSNGGYCRGNIKVPALTAFSAKIDGNVFLGKGFKAEGAVNLSASSILGSLDCSGGKFLGDGKEPALNVGDARIQGFALMRNEFEAKGAVVFRNSTIGSNLECAAAQFTSVGKAHALDVDGAKVHGSVFVRKGTSVIGTGRFVFASIDGSFQWRNIKSPESACLDLRFTKVGKLSIGQESWPIKGNLHIDGLRYDQIDSGAVATAEVQLSWLHRQPSSPFLAQPYEQLSTALRERGLEEDARKVMIAKNKDHAANLHWQPSWLWYGLFGKLIGYGYRPWRAFLISLIVILIGWLLFRCGYEAQLLTPTGDKAYVVQKDGNRSLSEHESFRISDNYPKFNAFIYSVETFVPFMKLGMAERWTPNAHHGTQLNVGAWGKLGAPRTTGSLLRYFLWFHIIAGWTLTTLWVGGLTGLVKT